MNVIVSFFRVVCKFVDINKIMTMLVNM
jgi:hypothetical protein